MQVPMPRKRDFPGFPPVAPFGEVIAKSGN